MSGSIDINKKHTCNLLCTCVGEGRLQKLGFSLQSLTFEIWKPYFQQCSQLRDRRNLCKFYVEFLQVYYQGRGVSIKSFMKAWAHGLVRCLWNINLSFWNLGQKQVLKYRIIEILHLGNLFWKIRLQDRQLTLDGVQITANAKAQANQVWSKNTTLPF
jgi:hypothetical protein